VQPFIQLLRVACARVNVFCATPPAGQALTEMRRFLPPDVAKQTRAEVQQAAAAAGKDALFLAHAASSAESHRRGSRASGQMAAASPIPGDDRPDLLGFFPAELAAYLKDCSLLHWCGPQARSAQRAVNSATRGLFTPTWT